MFGKCLQNGGENVWGKLHEFRKIQVTSKEQRVTSTQLGANVAMLRCFDGQLGIKEKGEKKEHSSGAARADYQFGLAGNLHILPADCLPLAQRQLRALLADAGP